MKLTLEALQVLDAIDRRGSFAAAGDELHRVPSAVTYSVRQLEDGLGLELFDRKGHRAILTEAGRELFPVMLALSQWGDRWAVDNPVLVRRHSCGERVQVDLVCHHCGEPITPDTVHAELGAVPPAS